MENQFINDISSDQICMNDSLDILFDKYPDPDTHYYCAPTIKSTRFTLLMKLVLLTKQYPIVENKIQEYIAKHPEELNKTNDKSWIALMIAAVNTNTFSTENTVKILIEAKANLDLKHERGWTALMMATRNSNTCSTENTVKMLIEAKADLSLQDSIGCTALVLSIIYSNTNSTENTVKMLIEAKADLDSQNNASGSTPLMCYINNSNTNNTENIVKILIEAKANLDLKNKEGRTTLMTIARYYHGRDNIVKMLVDAKADLELTDLAGNSALLLFSQFMYKTRQIGNIIKMLVEAKANVNAQNNKGVSPLMYIINNGMIPNNSPSNNSLSPKAVIKMLIEAKANLDLQDNNGWSALMKCVKTRYSFQPKIRILIEAKANVNLRNNKGDSALMLCAKYNNCNTLYKNITNLLIGAKANLNFKNNKGWTALHISTKNYYNKYGRDDHLIKTLIGTGSKYYYNQKIDNGVQFKHNGIFFLSLPPKHQTYKLYSIASTQYPYLHKYLYKRRVTKIIKILPFKCQFYKYLSNKKIVDIFMAI